MKILLINPPVFNDIGRCKSESPPLSLLYLAAYLEKHGYADIKVIDADIEKISWPDLKNLFVKEDSDIIGIGGTSIVLPALIKTAKIAKEALPKSLVIAGGFGPTNEPEKVLKISEGTIDFVVLGEGEDTLLELVKWHEGRIKDFRSINGLAFLQDGKPILTERREYIKDLDSIPWPAFHLLTSDFSKYPGQPIAKSHYEIKKPIITILASRGCPHRCTFCSLGSKLHRARNPKDIVDEIEHYKNKFGVKSVAFYDDEFVGMTPKQNEWVKDICNEIIERKLDLNFLTQGRCSPYIELETLKKMKEAGFAWIWWGVESGSQRILDEVIYKDIKLENVYKDLDLAKQAGLKSLMFIMVGFPKETPADIKMSMDLIKKIKPEEVSIHITCPYPGSKLRKYLEDHNLVDNKLENLEDYYKLAPAGRYVNFHTEELTAAEIEKYYKLFVFKFGHSFSRSIKFGIKSLATLNGWKKLPKRIKILINLFFSRLEISRSK
ncbi:MAG: B12-binding domain-containing radical SAM protein [Candidatus Nealsonbacteria bacterium]|nr:B12-binding domain-containing radical SAM protein [Candidatus Nealsonbacteria bacterium]